MANEQDIVSLGLDISSFDAKKKAVLKEYITLFNSLAKYDGKIFNPVMGDGLTKFNTSAVETNRLLELISAQITNLNANMLRMGDNIGTGFVKAVPKVAAMTSEVAKAGKATEAFNVQAGGTVVKLDSIGKNLTHMLTQLRYLAYVLPGIGIAGIFNLAFEAIGHVVDKLGILSDAQIEETNNLTNSTKGWNEYAEALDKVFKNYEKLAQYLPGSSTQSKDIGAANSARGLEQGIQLNRQLETNNTELKELAVKLAGSEYELGIQQKLKPQSLEDYVRTQINSLDKEQYEGNQKMSQLLADRGVFQANINAKKKLSSSKAGIELVDAQLKTEQDKYKANEELIDKSFKVINDLGKTKLEIDKFNSDQSRKLLVETSKDNISVEQDKYKAILDNDKKFHDSKIAAARGEYNDAVSLASTNRINVTGTSPTYGDKTNNPNLSATPADIAIAINKQGDDIKKAKIKLDKDIENIDVEFYQRKIKATTETNKDELEKDAVANDKIFNNVEKSLSERLGAYQNYIILKQRIRDLDYGLEIQRGAANAGGLTSLTPEEKKQIETHNAVEKANIVANSEKEVYNIVLTSLDKIIKDTENKIKEEEDLSKESYVKALHALNKQFDDKHISLRQYHEKKKKIDEKYEREYLDNEIKKDQQDLLRLEYVNLTKIQKEVDYRKKQLVIAKAGGNATEIDKAQGAVDAAEEAETSISNDIKTGKDKLLTDKLKREKLGHDDDDLKKRKEWAEQIYRIEEKLNKEIVKLVDERYNYEIAMLEKRKAIMDAQIANEQRAVEVSSLSEKDKLAFEIQLQAEKQTLDENAARNERDLKVKEFDFNKKLALDNAGVGIAAAIIKDGLTSPKSIADAIIGAIEIGAILASQPPAFAEGVEDFVGGFAKYGEKGAELVKIPGKNPFIAMSETISYLPKGTDIIPLTGESPVFDLNKKDESWAQTRFLAKQIKNNNREIKNIFKPTIIVDMNFESRKRQILGN